MTDMTLHWSPLSPFVRKVMCCLHERGLASRVQCIRTKVSSQAPNLGLIGDNPLIRIPTLVLGDGQALFDSVVICEYLDSLDGPPTLYPSSGAARWQALRWQALGDGLCDTLIGWRHERDRPSDQQNPALLNAAQVKVDATLDRLEAEVGDLNRAEFGIGHIAVGCALGYLGVRFTAMPWRDGRPGLSQWHAAFEGRPSALITRPPLPE
ncbi:MULTISPECIES: glutathione S-transferase family protein [unclassified Pseudomonas]|uniref:glutathione S-transferase family protein n=1 Tax=unclassified Pseudomonas TaxID=196821 RepID=UPI000BCDE874|nr:MULTISPECIES: glutathione S-transferase family protein [unclassified Pseudomonas]PVZ10513.1 glutathione S-transferase [Pseudomonas sp. URIL14HWK12:I12]PVZ21939.1 glutathione S-transferase [Pseudomonas sp. URIL14HWK12:I10]PVZ30978.1 glutathione S-transferase [Pseudomonas sp. URIL14HWK12:I11]SNZ17467.1 Glutathione S-transferase [Pseudomonas sp. URIL14HWK12:I9]